MKAIFLCEKPENISSVFDGEVISAISEIMVGGSISNL